MNILLTGHIGYVGSNLIPHLVSKGHVVANYNDDLLDQNWETKDKKYDMVVHLAGLAGVRKSFEDPDAYYKNNVELTRRIFKYCERTKTRVIYASSSNAHEWWLNPYATTKKMIEEMASMMTVKPIGMKFHTVFPGRTDMLYHRLQNNEVEYINQDHYRDWIHIDDLCKAICTIIENYGIIQEEVIDIGTGHMTPVEQVAKKFGFNGEYRRGEAPGERMHTMANIETLLNLGWTPKRNILNENCNPE